ncbi:unnamed protein product, partial [Mesorhabditis belari]|uniref:Major facilitator superfamily (MFS) profile domain-containing protein n=1 Tax=Mesorhabditis belari TaxID=2138241 RepID=A0AAF3EDS4_9BILA
MKAQNAVPDGGWGWVIVFGSFLLHVAMDGFVYPLGVVSEALVTEFASTTTISALMLALLTGITLGVGPLASALTTRFGCRLTVISGAFLAALGSFLSAFASSMWMITFFVGVLIGVGCGLIYCPAVLIVTIYFEKKRSLATGMMACGAGVGTILFGPIDDFVVRTYGWRCFFFMFSILFIACSLVGVTFRSFEKKQLKDVESDEFLRESPEVKSIEESQQNNKDLLKSSTFLLYLISFLMTCIGYNSPIYFLPKRAQEALGLTSSDAAWIVSIYGMSNTIGRFVLGWIGDKEFTFLPSDIGKDKPRNRLFLYISCLTLCGFLCIGVGFFQSFFTLCIFAGIFGFLLAAAVSLVSVILVDLVGIEKIGSAFGIVLVAQAIGTLIGPPIAGWLSDLSGDSLWSFVFSGLNLTFSGVILLLRFAKSKPFIYK